MAFHESQTALLILHLNFYRGTYVRVWSRGRSRALKEGVHLIYLYSLIVNLLCTASWLCDCFIRVTATLDYLDLFVEKGCTCSLCTPWIHPCDLPILYLEKSNSVYQSVSSWVPNCLNIYLGYVHNACSEHSYACMCTYFALVCKHRLVNFNYLTRPTQLYIWSIYKRPWTHITAPLININRHLFSYIYIFNSTWETPSCSPWINKINKFALTPVYMIQINSQCNNSVAT